MKNRWVFPIFILVFLSFASCIKDGNESIQLNDPQEIPFITDFLPADLLEFFGEENIFFGDVPPIVDMQFMVDSLQFECLATNLQFYPIGNCSPLKYYHNLTNQFMQIADYYGMNSQEQHCYHASPVYLTGHVTAENDSLFTAYYMEEPGTEGHPVNAILLSGKITSRGIQDFRYGYKIMRYLDEGFVPRDHGCFDPESIFIFKDKDGIAEAHTWFNESLLDSVPSSIH